MIKTYRGTSLKPKHETVQVYGLGALAADDAAVSRVFAAKGRPGDNPLIVHFADGLRGLQEVSALSSVS